MRDIQDINMLISQVGITLPSQIFIAAFSLGFMIFYSGVLTLVSLGVAGLMIFSTLVLFPLIRHKMRRLLVLSSENQGILVETFKGAIALKSTNSAPSFWEEFQRRYGEQAYLSFRAMQMAIVSTTLSGFLFRYSIYNQDDLSLDCLRKQVVLVSQYAHFWSRTIIDNLRLAAPDATFEDIVKACQIAKADEFISKLPDKYQTVLGEFGANLSGGQKQRLAIARGIITDPPILILDESTSALDPVNETQVLDNLLFYRQGKTTILISHRPRVIQRADWIIFLENGQAKFQGNQSDLLSKPGNHLEIMNYSV